MFQSTPSLINRNKYKNMTLTVATQKIKELTDFCLPRGTVLTRFGNTFKLLTIGNDNVLFNYEIKLCTIDQLITVRTALGEDKSQQDTQGRKS